MATQFRLSFSMRQRHFDFNAIVSETVWNHVAADLDDQSDIAPMSPYIGFRTLDGTLELVNRSEICAVRHRSDVVVNAPDSLVYEGPVQIRLRGRRKPMEELPSSDESLADFIIQLERGPDLLPVVRFLDENDETLRLPQHGIVRVTVSTVRLDAGYEALDRE